MRKNFRVSKLWGGGSGPPAPLRTGLPFSTNLLLVYAPVFLHYDAYLVHILEAWQDKLKKIRVTPEQCAKIKAHKTKKLLQITA